MIAFALATIVATLLVVAAAIRFRGRFFAIFCAVMLTLHGLGATLLLPAVGWAMPLFIALHATVYLHFLSLCWAHMRPFWWRLLVTWPGHFFWASIFLALPWAVAVGLGFHPWAVWFPFALGAIGLMQSFGTRESEVELTLDGRVVEAAAPRRHPLHGGASNAQSARPTLRLVQITDPHLGPFMSTRRLRRICQRAVERDPHLIVLTGDFLTMESSSEPRHLHDALAPLAAAQGRVFACLGNHDHEAPDIVSSALAAHGIQLLVDDAVLVDTPAGPVQLLGFDFHFRERRERMARVCAALPRVPRALRLVLLHDPSAFRHLPEGEGDLVLSGHTHGGQVGLVSLGLSWTPVHGWWKIPDHGFWAQGPNRMYIHRGTGHYGFPLRLGVPAEDSLLLVHLEAAESALGRG